MVIWFTRNSGFECWPTYLYQLYIKIVRFILINIFFRYQALLNYFPNSPEELNLEVGKMYVALKDKGGGWLLGKSVAKGTVGLFPSSLVKFLRK